LRSSFRVLDAAQAVDEVAGSDGRAVRPDMITQSEGPDQTIFTDFITVGHAQHRAAIWAIRGQADDHVANDNVLPLRG